MSENQPKCILLVEDDLFIKELYQRQLTKAGFEVDTAEDGPAGLVKATQKQWSLILLDIMLPEVNGLDLLRTLKTKPETQKIPVILLTNLGQDSLIKEAFDIGAEAYLIKSAYTPKQIVEEVKEFFNKKQDGD
ncbi:response regulator [Patescibacteria group bacterium]|nr:response regulator [Patescibacteria group bacterium]MBU1867912.1 response regulator [Patescibacteria group bacterium]